VKGALQFAGALLIAVLAHLVGARFLAEWSSALDLMLIVLVFKALDGNTLGGLVAGLLAGWATDAVAGTPFGLFGVVDTIIGYGAAFAVQRVVIQRAAGAALFFAVAALCQQGLLLGLSLLLLVAPESSAYSWLPIKVAATGILGAALFHLRRRLTSKVDLWRHTRRTRIRLER
jgi:rod shape-determining protein MreD